MVPGGSIPYHTIIECRYQVGVEWSGVAGRVGAGGQVAFAFQIYFGGKDENIT